MKYIPDAARLADQVVGTLFGEPEFGESLMVRDTICGVPVFVGVVDVNPDAVADLEENPHWSAADVWFNGWSAMVDEMRDAYLADVVHGVPSLRLIMPADALLGGVRPHDEPGQPFRLDWLVGGPMVDRCVRQVWNHGRGILPYLTRSVVIPGSSKRPTPRGVQIPDAVSVFASSLSWSNLAVGFGGVDVAVWALAGIRDPRRLLHDTLDDGALSEVVELADLELYGAAGVTP